MISLINSMNIPLNEQEKCLDSQFWHACAGGMVQMPQVNSKVYYFAQGHIEHAQENNVDFKNFPRVPPLVLCRVSGIKFMADMETDEVFAKVRLVPLRSSEFEYDEEGFVGFDKSQGEEKSASFAKTLTQSDANNGGGFSVPRYCAETIFPRLDYSAEPPVQTILAKDVHGQVWKFRHIYRGTPRRHLLTTGWSNFVNQKKLVAGDSIVFLRADNGDLCVGIRRAKRGIGGGQSPCGWNTTNCAPRYGGFLGHASGAFDGGENGTRKVCGESVSEVATRVAEGKAFEVVYYPRASTPEFFVKASSVKSAMRIQWCSGMRFKMPFETEDSSRISWFMGTISSVHVDDPIRWPNSPWRLLQVAWDEPDLLQNVKRVNPWLVELVSNMPAIHQSPFSPPRKKLRVPQPPDCSLMGQLSMPSVLSNPLNFPAGIQGARHAQYGLFTQDPHFYKLQSGLFPFGFQQLDYAAALPSKIPVREFNKPPENNENVSCLLTIGNSSPSSNNNTNSKPTHSFFLFGQPILTEQQLSQSCSGDTAGSNSLNGTANPSDGSGSAVVQNGALDSSSDEQKSGYGETETTGHCKVFMESEDVGRTLDLSGLGSYEELYRKLLNMFSLERSEMLSNVLYRDETGAVKHTGDEPFSNFSKTARRLTILMDSSSDNMGR